MAIYRQTSRGATGDSNDPAAVNSTDDNTTISLLKGIYALLSGAGAGDATAANQVTGNATLTAIDGRVDGLEATSAAILAKIIGAPATEAKQDTGNTSLASIISLLTTQAGYLDGLEALETALIVLQTASSASITELASAATSAQLLAANASRKGLILTNTDANAVLIKYGATASVTSFTARIVQNASWEMPSPIYTGQIDAIWEADGAGSLYATEM